MTRLARVLSTLALTTAAALAAGCSADDDGGSDDAPVVEESALEDEVATQLEAQVGQAPDSVDCPGDLTGEVGEEMRCTLSAGPDTVGLTITVDAVDGETVGFNILVDEEVQ